MPPPVHLPVPQMPLAEPQGVLWAATPALTFGLASPLTFVYAGYKTRSAKLGAMGVGYAAAYLGVFALFFTGGAGPVLGALLFMALWVTSSVHAIAARREVFPRRTLRDRANQQAIHVAQYRRALREQARQILATDPALAVELCIGRPDLPRAYDDGGLIDVNNCPPATLGLLPGMTDDLVNRVLEARRTSRGFVSVEELAVDADLPPDLVQRIGEYAVFIR